jgi:methionyl aminopeptidase
MIIRKSASEIETMARAGQVVADTLALLADSVRPGITTHSLDAIAEEFILSQDGIPTFKGYRGYPAATCLSPNDMVVHGIPGPVTLADGDLLSADVGVTLDGFVADSAWTYPVGEIAPEAQRLLEVCEEALEAGIAQARVGNAIGDISRAVQTVTEEAGFGIIRSLVGHGVGRSMHEDPQVPNFVSSHRGPELKAGMTIAIEPMITVGSPEVYVHDDEWSISTVDGSLAAHFEHTIAVTAEGPRILTTRPGGPGTMATRVARRSASARPLPRS